MEAYKNNKGFSLVELIIVMAIMAVLIGILAPAYFKYVEKTKRTTDCTSIGAVLDACEVLVADPDVIWPGGDSGKITITIDTNQTGALSSYTGSGPVAALKELVPEKEASLTADWGPFVIEAEKVSSGHVVFNLQSDSQIGELAVYSTALSNRLE